MLFTGITAIGDRRSWQFNSLGQLLHRQVLASRQQKVRIVRSHLVEVGELLWLQQCRWLLTL